MSSNASIGGNTLASTRSKSETVNYLLLYEAMVRHQDLEFDATHDHIALTMGRIQYLGRKSTGKNNNGPPDLVVDEAPKGMLTYLQMRRCLLRLGYTWNRSLPFYNNNNSGSSVASATDYDDDVSVMSANSAFTGAGSAASSSTMATRDIIATDAQLIMLLTTLVEMEERHRAVKLAASEEEEDEDEDEDGNDNENDANDEDNKDAVYCQGLFLPEFIQAYKLIIGGMQSLQTYPSPDHDNLPMDQATLQDLRLRSRERTLGLLRLFGPDSKLYKDAIIQNNDNMHQQSAGESPTAHQQSRRKTRDGLQHTPNRSNSKNAKAIISAKKKSSRKQGKFAKDGLLPRLTEEEIRKMVHSKDTALAKILEDHESEMNVMAVNMEDLRIKGVQTQRLINKRRKRTRTAMLLGIVLLACAGGTYEYHKREQVRTEIAEGREEEREADAVAIGALRDSVKNLTSKLSDAEATIRYEEGRYEDVKKKYEKVTKTLGETEGKWLLDQRELERCRVTRKELDTDLTSIKSHNAEIEEEVGWCRERMQSTARAMEGMERALQKSRLSNNGDMSSGPNVVVPSFADIAKEIDEVDKVDGDKMGLVAAKSKGGDNGADNNNGDKKMGSKGSKNKPVLMEMKYNKSFRNAVFLRQAYSVVAGMVVSSMFPSIAKIIGFLFLR
mmetsp:Transcript_12422/g.26990  ORF Transcript_12422/g.26990 Transcript_12422/m.26990 type:complete len:669 (+) Transcript_12422:293-2299(+)|eukprot:CAMPEP_0172299490 /NCGR_PEP_ID=MMETSP1058-20130122/1776_1 /TAXON_ID=83371 /ORGANISM="Detonula confervacea, Strain CCMP 353" /LENGTH=668 /DNA_ID=CAMNT_0013008947 /DNA_START=228 /DNA_END=2234 /DNA_ORIENTATION=-